MYLAQVVNTMKKGGLFVLASVVPGSFCEDALAEREAQVRERD